MLTIGYTLATKGKALGTKDQTEDLGNQREDLWEALGNHREDLGDQKEVALGKVGGTATQGGHASV